MIYEFALDPDVLSDWQSFRYFYENFGVEHGRLISRFPKKWKRMVYNACSHCLEIEKKRIEERLTLIDNKLIRNNREYDGNLSWLINAENQHSILPFRAIISNSNPNQVDFILIADEINNEVELWNIPTQKRIIRKAATIASCASLLFGISTEILFVDPHFAPEMNRYKIVFRELMKRIIHVYQNIERIEFHLEQKSDFAFFKNECEKVLSRFFPKGLEILFIRWKQIEDKEALHPRFILTNRGGIHIESGLDEGRQGETTLVSLLEYEIFLSIWNDFQKTTSPFEFVDEITINGSL